MSENKEKKTQNKKPGRIRKSFSSRQFKSGAYSSVITVIVLTLVVIVNLVFNKLDLSTDLTSDSLFTLTKESQKVLKDVKDDITIYYMVANGSEQDYIQRVIKQYNKVSDNIKVVKKDPVVYPNFSKKYVDDAVSDNDVIVVDNTTEQPSMSPTVICCILTSTAIIVPEAPRSIWMSRDRSHQQSRMFFLPIRKRSIW